MSDLLRLRGAAAHNLDRLDLDLPHHRWTSVVGVSGSGKTSLVFDTLVREGQRRFLSAWAPRARLRLGKLGDPAHDSLTGLPVPLAIGVDKLGRNPRSTVGTATGLLDLLRLWWARDGQPGPLPRSALSFNRDGACPRCKGLGVQDEVAEDLLVADPTRSIRGGALRPTLPNGYTVYSQVTVDVMDTIARAHGFTVDTPWQELSRAQQDVVFYGTDALVVPFGKHSIESRLKWQGITAKPREEGHYRGLIPVIRETLKRSRNDNILKYTRTMPCSDCRGSRLAPRARAQHVDGVSLTEVVQTPLRGLRQRLEGLGGAVAEVVHPQLVAAAEQATALGLGHLSLARATPTLSDGELQRCRLLSQLGLRLSGLLLAFDEPTLGLHPDAQPGLAHALRRLVAQGNTLLVVEHDPHFVGAADQLLALGPGAGPHGGRITHHGPLAPAPLPTAPAARPPRPGSGWLWLRGARRHNVDTNLSLRHGALNIVMGPSGAGKSTLIFQLLLPSLRGGPPAGVTLEGAGQRAVHWIDATPLGRTPRSTPATYTGLFDRVRKRFAATPEAKAAGLGASHFSHNHKQGRCPACEGLGVERIGLHLLDDVERPCPVCDGGRYRPEVLSVRVNGHTIADVLQCTAPELRPVLGDDTATDRMLASLEALGLGHLQLGRSTTTLSRGEAQRVKLATVLGAASSKASMVLLDEPDRGLHPADLARLLRGLHALADAGHTVVAISHHRHLWLAADHLIQLVDGRAEVLDAPPPPPPAWPPPAPATPPDHIHLVGVRTNNLQDLSVRIPHRALTVVTGPSGSGKSSLVFDTLAAEAQRRYAETLPFTVRRELRRLPRPALVEAHGLTPTVSLRQGLGAATHGTVATVCGVDAPLRLLWSRLGRVDGSPVQRPASGFSRRTADGRCPTCEGRGSHRRVDPDRIVTDPTLSLRDGAARGTVPGTFFTAAEDRHLALLAAVIGDDAVGRPWQELSSEAQHIALHGAGDAPVSTTWRYQRGKRTGTHELNEPWRGLVALIEEEAPRRVTRKKGEAWWAVFADRACAACDGEGLVDEARRATVAGVRLPEVMGASVRDAQDQLRAAREPLSTADAEVFDRLHRGIARVLSDLIGLGLGHLGLSAPLGALSPSERQRLHLAEVLHSDLVGLTLALDEPGTGLNDDELGQLLDRLRALVAAGQTVVVVSHRRALRDGADHIIDLGPGAGSAGGRIVAEGPPADVPVAQVQLPPVPGLVLSPPGAGGDPVPAPGRQQTVLTAMGLLLPLQKLFHAAHPALPRAAFSFHSPAGRCSACKGSGTQKVSLDILADIALPCPVCHGHRYRPEVLAARWQGHPITDILEAPAGRWATPMEGTALGPALRQLVALSLGHLPLGTAVSRLSGGEARRLGLAAAWSGRPEPGRCWFLERPDEGLHDTDLPGLVEAIRVRTEAGEHVRIWTQRALLQQATTP